MSHRTNNKRKERQNLFKDLSPQPQVLEEQQQQPYLSTEAYSPYAKQDASISNTLNKFNPFAYDSSANALAALESQSEDTLDVMSSKVESLKGLTMAMGKQINTSRKHLQDLGQDMGVSSDLVGLNMQRMKEFSKSGVGIKLWGAFISLIMLWWFYSWLF